MINTITQILFAIFIGIVDVWLMLFLLAIVAKAIEEVEYNDYKRR